jgi:hypothetical protein
MYINSPGGVVGIQHIVAVKDHNYSLVLFYHAAPARSLRQNSLAVFGPSNTKDSISVR